MKNQIQKHHSRRNMEEKLPNNESYVYNRTPNKTFDKTGGKLLQKNKLNMMDTTFNLTVSLKTPTHLLSVSHTHCRVRVVNGLYLMQLRFLNYLDKGQQTPSGQNTRCIPSLDSSKACLLQALLWTVLTLKNRCHINTAVLKQRETFLLLPTEDMCIVHNMPTNCDKQ
jgi:hypothetical protein